MNDTNMESTDAGRELRAAPPQGVRRPRTEPLTVDLPAVSPRDALRWWLRGWLAFPARAMLDRPRPGVLRAGAGSAGPPDGQSRRPTRSQQRVVLFVAAFAAIYLIWGSTYLAIAWGVETIPPLLLMGVRFVLAGGALYAWGRLRGGGGAAPAEWRTAVVAGALLFLLTHGLIAWAEQRIASGLTALLGASVPVWMVLLDWVRPGGLRPPARVLSGIAVGLVGVGVLVVPASAAPSAGLLPAAAVLVAAVSWAAGSIYARGAKLPKSHALAAGMQLLAGGLLLLIASVVSGETADLEVAAVSGRSLLALGYLTVFGSLVAYSAYLWLLRATTPARVATHAFVNPVVAVALGWFAGEAVTWSMAAAGVLVLMAVVRITRRAKAHGGEGHDTAGVPEPRRVARDSAAPRRRPAVRRHPSGTGRARLA